MYRQSLSFTKHQGKYIQQRKALFYYAFKIQMSELLKRFTDAHLLMMCVRLISSTWLLFNS